MIRVAIIDDHAVVRQGLRFLLEQQPDIEVIGESADGESGVVLVAEQLPDVVLLDLLMPKLDGTSVVREIKRITPAHRLLYLHPITKMTISLE